MDSRNYARFSQADLYAKSRQVLEYLKEDLADFQRFDKARFTTGFLADFEKAITEVRDYIDDETILDQLTGKTANLDEVLAKCRKAYKHYKYFVLKAFEDDIPKQNEFGLDNYDTARRSQAHMIVFMNKIYRAALAHKNELIAAGYSEEQIQELAQLRDELEQANLQQDTFKNKRQQFTQLRRKKLDALMRFITQTCEAGKIIYEDENPAKYERYILQTSNSPDSEAGSIELAPNQTAEISSQMSTQKIAYFTIPPQAKIRYVFSQEKQPKFDTNAPTLSEGENEIIGEPAKPYLYIQNYGTSPALINYEIGKW